MALVHVLAAPNDDLAVQPDGRVWKRKPHGWARLDYVLPRDSLMYLSRSRERTEVAAMRDS